MRHKERVHLGEGIIGRTFRAAAFSYTLGEGDIALLAACKDAAAIQMVSYKRPWLKVLVVKNGKG